MGSVCDAVEDRVTGLLVPPSSPDALANALEQIIVEKELRVKLGVAGCQLVAERFTIARLNGQLEELFRRSCGRVSSAPQ